MKTISKKLLSLLLVVIMVASVIPFQAFAVADGDPCLAEGCTTGKLEERAAVEPTCTTAGNSKYFTCDVSTAHIFDESGNSISAVPTIPAKHTIVSVAANATSCPHYKCSVCSKLFADAEGTAEKTLTDFDHIKTAVSAKDATCVMTGNVAYEECDKCGTLLEGGVVKTLPQVTKPIVADAHTYSARQGGDGSGCWYYTCSGCNEKFAADASGNATTTKITTVPSHVDGNSDNTCDVCGYAISSSGSTEEDVTNGFKIVVRYINTRGDEIKSDVVTPDKVVVKDNAYVTFTSGANGAFSKGDTVNDLRFNVKTYFAAPQTDDKGVTVKTSDERVIAVERGKTAEVKVTVTYENPPEVTVTFKVGKEGKFTATANANKTSVAETVVYGESLPAAPVYEGKTSAYRALQKWAIDEAGKTLVEYGAGKPCPFNTNVTLYAVYDATPATDASLNICFFGTNVTSTVKTLSNLSSDAAIDSILSKVKIDELIDSFNYGYQPVSYTLYKNTSGAVYAAGTTVADVNKVNGTVYINVKPLTYTATFQALDGKVNALIANGTIKKIENLRYGQTKIEMPIPVATGNGDKNYTFYGWREVGSGNIYKFVDNTKMLLTYSYNRDTTFEPVWNTSEGVYVNVYFNNITNRGLYTVQIHDLQAGDHLTVNKVLNLLSQYFTWTDYRGLYTNDEWNQAVRNNFTTGSGNKSVDGVLITTADRQEFNLMLLGAKQNGITITNANLSVIGIGVNANGAYAPADPTNPKTGNEAEMLGVAMASMVMAVITLAGVTYYTRKKEEMI